MTIGFSDGYFELSCSMCDYKVEIEMIVGTSIGTILDTVLVTMLTPCPNCKGKGLDKSIEK